jgi:hypothetical protein
MLRPMMPGTGSGGFAGGTPRPERPGSGMPYGGRFRPGSVGGMPYPPSMMPPGSTGGGAEEPSNGNEEQESNIELVIYGVVTLYNQYPPRQPLTAVEPGSSTTDTTPQATPPAGKQP